MWGPRTTTDATPARPSADWEFLIAHHLPNRYSRTLSIRLRARSYHFCARCSGEVVGFVTTVVALGLISSAHLALLSPIGVLVLAVLPLVAWVDWISQTVGRRESSNRLRFVSGVLVGVSIAGLLSLVVLLRWELAGAGVLVVALYLGGALAVLRRTGAWRKVLAEHFP